MKEFGAQLRCFDHTIQEIREILESIFDKIVNEKWDQAFGPTIDHFVDSGYTPSDLLEIIDSIESDLESLGVVAVQAPSYSKELNSFVIDEVRIEELLRERVKYNREVALERDRKSIAAIMMLREGKRPNKVETSRATFITKNTAVAAVSKNVYSDRNILAPVLTDFYVTTYLWVKRPTAFPDLPMNILLANSYAAIRPSEKFWHTWLEHVEKLFDKGQLTEEQYYLLRSTMEARQSLMEVTFGDEDVIADGTVEEILERAQAKMHEEISSKYDQEKTKRKQAEEKIERQQKDAATERSARVQADKTRAARFARRISRVISLSLLVVFAMGLIFSIPWEEGMPPNASSGLRQFILPIIFSVMFALTLLSQHKSMQVIMKPLERKIAQKIYDLLYNNTIQ